MIECDECGQMCRGDKAPPMWLTREARGGLSPVRPRTDWCGPCADRLMRELIAWQPTGAKE